MDCRNCGAPMELFERRRYYFCRYCGSFHFLESPEIEGIQVLGRSRIAAACPVCKATLARSLLDGTHPVEYCEQCRGVLVARQSFADIVRRRRPWASGAPRLPSRWIEANCSAKSHVQPAALGWTYIPITVPETS
jgi:Zn-finger nucleic acid-binding protein